MAVGKLANAAELCTVSHRLVSFFSLGCSLPDSPETIELEVRTNSANGLLLWQGVVSECDRAGVRQLSVAYAGWLWPLQGFRLVLGGRGSLLGDAMGKLNLGPSLCLSQRLEVETGDVKLWVRGGGRGGSWILAKLSRGMKMPAARDAKVLVRPLH